MSRQRGQFGIIVGVIILVLVLAMIGLFSVCTGGDDDNSLGRIELVSYRGGPDCYQYGDCRDHRRPDDYDNGRDDNRRAGISPGPFDRSPVDIHDNRLVVCFPFSRCDGKDDGSGQDQQPPMGIGR